MRVIVENVKETRPKKIDRWGHIGGLKDHAGEGCLVVILKNGGDDDNKEKTG